MKILSILSLTVGTTTLFTSVHAQHHLPAAATSNINGGINSPTSSNVDIESVATISDEANDTARKLHDVLTSVKDIMEEEFGLATAAGDGSGRRLSNSHKSDKGIDIIDEVLALVLVIVLLLAEFLGHGGGYDTSMLDGLLGGAGEEEDDIADEITAAHHGHDGSSSKAAKSGGTDGSAKASKESKSSKSGACPLGPFTEGDPCCSSEDCENGGSTRGFCQVVAGDFCIDGDAAAGSVDCSTGNTCTGSPGQGSCTGTEEICIIVPIETCTPATAPATGICFFVEFTCPGSGPGDNSVGEGGACCEDADCSCAEGGCRQCIDGSSPVIAPATGTCQLL